MGNLFPMKIGNEEGWQWNKKDILFMSYKTIVLLRRNREAYFMIWTAHYGFTFCTHGHACCEGLGEGRVEEPLVQDKHTTPCLLQRHTGPHPEAPVSCLASPWPQGWELREEPAPKISSFISSGSMAVEERLFSLKVTFDKWGRNNHHIQKTNQASQEICM